MKSKIITIKQEQAGQRIDNFLRSHLKGVPKSRIYRALRKGEVRVNKGRIDVSYRLQGDDQVRIPPLRMPDPKEPIPTPINLKQWIEQRILYEDSGLIVLNKPSGIPVHGGTGISMGLIEILRELRPKIPGLELIHRLDRDTSGCLLIAKKRRTLLEWHDLLTRRQVKKRYLMLVKGRWKGGSRRVEEPLLKNILQSGERVVKVDEEGKSAVTRFTPLKRYSDATLLAAEPVTGRTHQIRVHAASIGYPIAGDEKYGDNRFNRKMRENGLKRLFLHSVSISRLQFCDDAFNGICAPLDDELRVNLKGLEEK